MPDKNETSPLMSSLTQPEPLERRTSGAFYFVERSTSILKGYAVDENEGSSATGDSIVTTNHEVMDNVPFGVSTQDYASRPVPISNCDEKQPLNPRKGTTGFIPNNNNIDHQSRDQTTTTPIIIERKAPIKIEPKVWFSNERTFMAWMHTSTLLTAASIGIMAFGDSNPWSRVYGIILLPVAIAYVSYALYQYNRRAEMIRHRSPGPYEDRVGPIILCIMLMVSIVANFTLKLYSFM